MPRPRFAPITQPTWDFVPLSPEYLYSRSLTDTYGSILRPGMGKLTASPPPNVSRVRAESPLAAPWWAAPNWRFIATGNRLPPITRNAALPPTELTLLDAPSGFHVVTPAVSDRLTRPSDARAPNTFPLPRLV